MSVIIYWLTIDNVVSCLTSIKWYNAFIKLWVDYCWSFTEVKVILFIECWMHVCKRDTNTSFILLIKGSICVLRSANECVPPYLGVCCSLPVLCQLHDLCWIHCSPSCSRLSLSCSLTCVIFITVQCASTTVPNNNTLMWKNDNEHTWRETPSPPQKKKKKEKKWNKHTQQHTHYYETDTPPSTTRRKTKCTK